VWSSHTRPSTSSCLIMYRNLFVLYAFFWVILWRLNFICRRFGTSCLFHLHKRVGVKDGWGREMFGGIYMGKCVTRKYFPATHFPIKYPKLFSNPVILHTYPLMKMEQTGCSETSAYKIQTPGNYPEEIIHHSE